MQENEKRQAAPDAIPARGGTSTRKISMSGWNEAFLWWVHECWYDLKQGIDVGKPTAYGNGYCMDCAENEISIFDDDAKNCKHCLIYPSICDQERRRGLMYDRLRAKTFKSRRAISIKVLTYLYNEGERLNYIKHSHKNKYQRALQEHENLIIALASVDARRKAGNGTIETHVK